MSRIDEIRGRLGTCTATCRHDIEYLLAQNAKLRKALEIFANEANWLHNGFIDGEYYGAPEWMGDGDEPWKIAQEALRE